MRILNLILLCVLPELLFGQYTYFNHSVPPPDPSQFGEISYNLLQRGDTLITYSIKQNSAFISSRKHYFLNTMGDVISSVEFPFDLPTAVYQKYSECIVYDNTGFLLAGAFADTDLTTYQGRLYRFNESFEQDWSYTDSQYQGDTIEGSSYNIARRLHDEYIIAAGKISLDTNGFFFGAEFDLIQLTKFYPDGSVFWHKEFDFMNNDDINGNWKRAQFSDLFELSNGDILIFGKWDYKDQPFAIRFDSEGNFVSHISWGNPTENDWFPWVVQIGVDEFILVYQHAVGVSDIGQDYVEHKPRIGYFHANTMSLSDWHLYEHQHLYGYITDFEQTPDGGFVVLGFGDPQIEDERPHAYMMKIDANFNELWYHTYQPPIENFFTPEAWDLEITSDGGLAFVGNFEVGGESYYASWVVKTDACGDSIYNGCPVGVDEISNLHSGFSFYPNPAQKSIRISSDTRFDQVAVREVTGRILFSQIMAGPTKEMNLNISVLASGLYMLELCTEDGKVLAQRLVVE